MAGRYGKNNSSSHYNFTSANIKNVPVLDKYKCSQCTKWKPFGLFSNRELNKYRHQISINNKVTGESARLRCINCSDDQRRELECQGQCSRTLPLDKFSKTARKSHGSHTCIECTNWKEAIEPDVTVGPAPYNVLSPDEQQQWGDAVNTNPEIGDEGGSDDEHEKDGAASTSANWYNITPSQEAFNGSQSRSGRSMVPSMVVDSMTKLNVNYTPEATPSMGYKQGSDLKSVSSDSNPFERKTLSDGPDPWTAVDAARRPQLAPTAFNAWNNQGQQQVHLRYPSEQSTLRTSYSSAVSIQSASTNRGPSSDAVLAGSSNRNQPGNGFGKGYGQRDRAPQFSAPTPPPPSVSTENTQDNIPYDIDGDSGSDYN